MLFFNNKKILSDKVKNKKTVNVHNKIKDLFSQFKRI